MRMLPRARVRVLRWTLAALLVAAGAFAGPATSPQVRPQVPAQKIALFGVDAADWRVIDRLVASGRLPTFARLRRLASTGIMRADPPLLSPLIWTTMATGRTPEDHGVLDFMVDVPGGGQAPVNGGSRRVKALWEIWSEAGRPVLVTGWWATWPADRVRGAIVSDRVVTPHVNMALRDASGLVFPPSLWADIAKMVSRPDDIGYDALSRLVPVGRSEFERARAASRDSAGQLYRDPIAHFRAAVASARTCRAISTRLVPRIAPDFWATYYELVDTTSHLFSRDRSRVDRAVESAYREVDDALAETARVLDPGTLLVVVSDHGFEPPDAGIREDPADLTAGATAWHRPYGIVAAIPAGALAGTAAAPPRADLGIVSPLDIAPTVLARAGFAIASDMPGRVIPALAPSVAPRRIASYGAHRLPDAPVSDRNAAAPELERLRALGYVSGASATTSLARVNLGEILVRKGDCRGAARELEAVTRAEPLNVRALLWLARAYASLGRPEDALGIYDRLIHVSETTARPLDPVVVLAATDLDVRVGNLPRASARLDRLTGAVAGTPEALVAQGAVAEARGDTRVAERRYRAALAAAPSGFDALQRLMDLLLRERRAADAVAVTAAAARTFPASPQILAACGEAQLAARLYRDAERSFTSALTLAPDAEAVAVDLARARLLDGRPKACLDTLRTGPATRDADMVRGAALSALGDWPAAIDVLGRALAAGPPGVELLNALGRAQLEAGRRGDAIGSFERSLAIDPAQPAVRALLDRARGR